MKRLLLFTLIILVLTACSSYEDYNQTLDDRDENLNKIEEIEIYTETTPSKNYNKPIKLSNKNQENKYAQKVRPQNEKQKKQEKQEKKILDVPLIPQNPELKYGCEVTSLTMVLNYAGIEVDKMQLAEELEKDGDQVKKTTKGDITDWGDPGKGFVGDITGENAGYAVYDKPLENLMKKYMKERTLNLTGESFERLLQQVENGKPVVVWTTGDYKKADRWEAWQHGKKKIETPLDLHAVVLVGYEPNYIYINDPLSEVKNQKVGKETFIESWIDLKKRALSYSE